MERLVKISIGLGLIIGNSFSYTQSLFESSLQNTHEINVSNSLSLGGFIRSVSYIGNTPEEENLYLQSCYGQASLIMKVTPNEFVNANAEIRYRYGTEFGEPANEIDLREAYIDLFAGPFNFRIGKQIVTWGKGSLFNPTQRITPLDPLSRSPDTDDMNMGNWTVQGGIRVGKISKLVGYWMPLYASSRLLIDPVPMPDYITFKDPEYPSPELKNSGYGIKYDLFFSSLDASVSWFDGYNHLPGISYQYAIFDTIMMQPSEIALAEKAYRTKALGADLAVPAGSWIFRFEGAWQMTDGYNEFEHVPYPELSYTAELERTGNNMTVLTGYYGKHILDYSTVESEPELGFDQNFMMNLLTSGFVVTPELVDEEIKKRIESFNRLYNYQLQDLYHSAFIVLKGNFFYDRLELSLPVIYNFTTDEWTLRPEITYKPFDGVSIKAGYEGYYGPPGSLYDLIGPVLNSGFLSVKLIF